MHFRFDSVRNISPTPISFAVYFSILIRQKPQTVSSSPDLFHVYLWGQEWKANIRALNYLGSLRHVNNLFNSFFILFHATSNNRLSGKSMLDTPNLLIDKRHPTSLGHHALHEVDSTCHAWESIKNKKNLMCLFCIPFSNLSNFHKAPHYLTSKNNGGRWNKYNHFSNFSNCFVSCFLVPLANFYKK